jgi:transposase
VGRTGCAWRQLPFDFPPWQTVYWYFTRWEKDKVTEQILAVLRRRARAAQGRADEPTAGIIDSQSVKGADTVPRKTGVRRGQEGQRPLS